MKILLIVYMLFLSFIPLGQEKNSIDTFYIDVNNCYDYYETTLNEATTQYSLVVVRGLINSKAYYGFYFDTTSNIKIEISFDDARYTVNESDKNIVSAVSLRSDNKYELVIVDGKKEIKRVTLDIFFPSSVNIDNMTKGEGKGAINTELELSKMSSPIVDYAIYVSIGVIVISCLIIGILFIRKKGLFDKEKRKIGVLNIKEIYEKKTTPLTDNDFLNPNEEIIKEEKPKDEYEIKDIKAYLKEYGFNTNYSVLNDEEKNQIMLRLMFLKDNKKISLDDYYEETKELWKK